MKYPLPLLSFVTVFLFVSVAHADVVTFSKEYTYQASDFDSRNSSRTIALEMIKRLLLEELGTYLISETEVKNMHLTKDQVTTYSAGIVGAEVIDEKWDGKTYWLKAKVSADAKEVEKALMMLVEDKSKLKELVETRKTAEKLTEENERLRRKLQSMAKTKKRNIKTEARNIREYENTIRSLTALDWFEKGYKAFNAELWNEAIDAYTKAIKLKPYYADAYVNRGTVYDLIGNHQRAIEDYNKVIHLKTDYPLAYYNRGLAYGKLGNYQQKINDYKIAARLGHKDAQNILTKKGIQW